jgi:hypothetical protein
MWSGSSSTPNSKIRSLCNNQILNEPRLPVECELRPGNAQEILTSLHEEIAFCDIRYIRCKRFQVEWFYLLYLIHFGAAHVRLSGPTRNAMTLSDVGRCHVTLANNVE